MPDLCGAAWEGDLETVKSLLSKGTNINKTGGYTNWTALHRAAERGHLPVLKHLLQNGADLKLTDKSGWSALHYATRNNHPDVVQQLLEEGSDVNMADKTGRTPLILAAWNGYPALVRTLLLCWDANPDLVDKYDKNALMHAREQGHQDVVSFIQYGDITEDYEAVELTEDKNGKYVLTDSGAEYLIEEKDVTLSVPTADRDDDEEETMDIPISLEFCEPSESFTKETKPECHSEVLSLEPHGKCFDDYLIIKIPIIDKPAGKEVQLIYNPSDDEEKPKWVAVPKNNNTSNKSSFVISDESYYYIFTKHLCQYVVGISAVLPVPFEVVTAMFACYNEAACEISFTMAFTCACHSHNYDMLTSRDIKKKYGNFLLEPFSILVDKSQLQPITVDTHASSPSVKWEEVLNEKEQPCGILGYHCNQVHISKIHTVKSMYEPTNNVFPSMRVKVAITIKQLETWQKQVSVRLEQLIVQEEPSGRESRASTTTEKKRLCLCELPACVKKRGKSGSGLSQGTVRREMFSKGYLQSEYKMFFDSLEQNQEKYQLLLHKYYNVRVEKNNPVGKEAAIMFFKNEARANKGWGCLWSHLKEVGWKEALEVFEFVYERHQLLKRCDLLKKLIVFSQIKEDVLKLGLVPKEGVAFIKDISGKSESKVDYLIKHVLLDDRSYQNISVGLKALRSFNKILNVRYTNLLQKLICWPLK